MKLNPQNYQSKFIKTKTIVSEKISQFTQITGKDDKIKDLLSVIGSVDWEIENYKSSENQRDLSVKFHWGHNHRFNDHLSVVGRMGDRHINLLAEFIAGFELEEDTFDEKSVLDVGCWTGGTCLSLYAQRAGSVCAVEEVKKYAFACESLIKDIYEIENFSCIAKSIYETDYDRKFDVVYCPGVIYHLSDPVLALRRMFNSLKDNGRIYIETAGIDVDEPICRFEGNRIFHNNQNESKDQLNRGGWNWFIPSPKCTELWLEEAGFKNAQSFFSPVSKRIFAVASRERFQEITRAGLSLPDVV